MALADMRSLGRSQEQLSMRRWKDLQFYCCFLGKNDGIGKGACAILIIMARQILTPNLLILFVVLSVWKCFWDLGVHPFNSCAKLDFADESPEADLPERNDSGPFLEKRKPFPGIAVGMGGHILKLVPRLCPVPSPIRSMGWALDCRVHCQNVLLEVPSGLLPGHRDSDTCPEHLSALGQLAVTIN